MMLMKEIEVVIDTEEIAEFFYEQLIERGYVPKREEIEDLAEKTETAPEKREAQKRLAEEVTVLVHGREAFEQAVNISKALFSGDIKQLTAEEVKVGFKGVPSLE
ncbi:YozD family protein, partial [Bacillus thuringiensis]|nr:YozD family protein [Bacillus thuringiensis]